MILKNPCKMWNICLIPHFRECLFKKCNWRQFNWLALIMAFSTDWREGGKGEGGLLFSFGTRKKGRLLAHNDALSPAPFLLNSAHDRFGLIGTICGKCRFNSTNFDINTLPPFLNYRIICFF